MEHTIEMTNRIKIERLKRGWTQEHLAKASGLSVRTIQRLESSAEPALDSLASLASVFEIDLDELRPSKPREHFFAPWSVNLKLSTLAALAVLFGGEIWFRQSLWITPPIFFVLYLLFAIKGYSLKGDKLLVHRTGWSSSYSLRELQKMEVLPEAMLGSYRLLGVKGLFSQVGYFKNGVLGRYLAFATEPQNALVLSLPTKTLVITPDEPKQMQQSIEALLENRELSQ